MGTYRGEGTEMTEMTEFWYVVTSSDAERSEIELLISRHLTLNMISAH